MKPVTIIRTDFARIKRVQPDWHGTQGRAFIDERKIYIDTRCPEITQWGERSILEHEKAHFIIWDAGLRDLPTDKEELLADWIGLVRTPNRFLHTNEKHLKAWIKSGLKGWRVYMRIVQLLGIGDPFQAQHTAARLHRAS